MSSKSKRMRIIAVQFIGSIVFTIYSSLYLFYYFIGIFSVKTGNFGELIWSSGAAGTFFPLPIESGHLAVITTSQSIIDYLLYIFVISTGLVYLLPLLFGALTLFSIWRLFQIDWKTEEIGKERK